MKLLFDFFPIIAFFVTFKFYDDPHEGTLAATAVVIVATCMQVGFTWFRARKIEKMHLVTLILVVVLGGVTLLLGDEIYIKWKPTVINWLFAIAFLGSQYIGKSPLIRRMLAASVDLPDAAWSRLNFAWVIFFIAIGFANLYVIYNYDTATWVNFKLFGMMGLTFLFVLGQGIYMMRYIQAEPDDAAVPANSEDSKES